MVRGLFLPLIVSLLTGVLWNGHARMARAGLSDRPMAGAEADIARVPAKAFPDLALRDVLADSKPAASVAAPTVEQRKTAGTTEGVDGQAVATGSAAAPQPASADTLPVEPPRRVHTDYQEAMQEAIESRKMLFVYFHEPTKTAARQAFETQTLAKLEIQEKLHRYVYLELPTNAQVKSGGETTTLIKHASFSEMLGRAGVAVIDFAHERAEYYGHVVSTFPFTPGKYYRAEALSIILDLPPGTLTQRTMIYAVRIHPEAPKSTVGQFHMVLADEAKSHAHYQASIQVQGHHSWESRFHRINARLPNDVLAEEIVAESWPNETLVEACVECVNSWRQSPGHWSAVRSRHPVFGYDIKRGRNGIWYATGIFGRFR